MAERLRRLREQYGEGVRERAVDHDYDHLTGTRREEVPRRTFFLGEIWWTHRVALADRRPYREGSSHVPGLVTHRQPYPGQPVEIASARSRTAGLGGPADFAVPDTAGVRPDTAFALALRRPVARTAFGGHLATLSGADKQRLACALEALGGAAEVLHV